jgi:hypothetical protein
MQYASVRRQLRITAPGGVYGVKEDAMNRFIQILRMWWSAFD